MARTDRSWMRLRRSSDEWQKQLNVFLDSKFQGRYQGETTSCPCPDCNSVTYGTRFVVQKHLLTRGFHESFIQGEDFDDDEEEDSQGVGAKTDATDVNDLLTSLIKGAIRGDIVSTDEEPNERAKQFFSLLKEAEKELYPGCKEATKISFIVRLFQLKCMYGLSNSGLGAVLDLFSAMLPKGHCVPNTLDKVRKVVRDLGLDYQKIHACVNDCVLYRKDYEEMDKCPVCGESRWKTTSSDDMDEESSGGSAKKRAPRKILRYFPLTPRLERLYMRELTSLEMRWHKEGLVRDGKLRHPADSMAWKHVDHLYPDFASDPRHVRLGLASDGFNPFGMMNVTYTTWPVILIPYNLPPWLCLKQPFWMMSMLIPGPKSPGNNIDVYLEPLIDELKQLWTVGVEAWDAKAKTNFTLRAVLLWTINDFPAYGMLSGWSTKGKFACPYCNKDTDYLWLKFGCKHCYLGHRRWLTANHKWRRNKTCFNNKAENRAAPVPLSGAQVLQQYESFEQVQFGKMSNKRKQREEETRWHNWGKKSFFLNYPTGKICLSSITWM